MRVSDLRNILVIVDPTAEQHPALEKGATLARRYAARLELFACDTRISREMRMAKHIAGGSAQPFDADLKPMLESLAAHVRGRGIDVTTATRCADPLHTAVLDHVRSIGADLVVKDTHHHPLLKRTLITNTDWHLIRGCPVPLLLAKPAAWREQPVLIAAVDPLHPDDKPATLDHLILKWSRNLAQRMDGIVHLAHAYLPLMVFASPAGALPAMATAASNEALMTEDRYRRTELSKLARAYQIDERNVYLEIESPAGLLPSLAEKLHADVVVMGAISRRGMKRIFIGSTAEAVLERLPCDALIVKPPDFADVLPF
jgi:universal stress protein E